VTAAVANGTGRTGQDIPGWFNWVDRQLFATLLAAQSGRASGDLVELGTYFGKSAVIIGEHLRPGERFVALDLFGRTDLLASEDSQPNRQEVQKSYATLTRAAFEDNYRSWHRDLPHIVEGPSSVIMDHVGPGSVRFVHIDASHLYDHVRLDAVHAKAMVQPGGLVVFDDWRSEHTPGVTAAVWESVFVDGLIPLVLTPTKLYGVFSQPEPYRAALTALLEDHRIWSETQWIAGQPVPRCKLRAKPAPPPPAVPTVPSATVDEIAQRVADRVQNQVLERLPDLLNDASTITRVRRWWRARRRPQPRRKEV
jgi:Methyltransferase domain